MLSEGAVGVHAAGEGSERGCEKNHVRQTTDRGLFEEATEQQVMAV